MRGPYAKVAARNAALLERIRDLKAEHPFWGYRRIWAYLRYLDGLVVNQKRVYGVMKANDLLVKPNLKLRARRKADTTKPKPIRPNQWWGIDMTKVMIEGFGWVYLVVVLDWHTKKVVGHYAGLQARAWHWLVALNRAVNRQFPDGVSDQGLNLMATTAVSRPHSPSCAPAPPWASARPSPATATPRATPTPSGSSGRSRRSWSGCTSGPARPPSSQPWISGSAATTPATCTRPSATARPRPSRPKPSATPLSWPALAKRDAVHIGPEFATVLWMEGLFRNFTNRRQLAAYAGLAPSPWKSGCVDREQGIAKSGNPRLRTTMVELAWLWLRYQPDSALSRWFRERVGSERGRIRRIAIVALARKLLVALWRYTTLGDLPVGAALKTA
jgi:hypothetical protein